MSLKQIIITAVLIRLLISPFLFHPDIKDINLRVSFLSAGVFNIYDYLEENQLTKQNAPDFAYPPLTYFFLGSYQFIVKPFLGSDFNQWLFDFSGLSTESIYIFRYLLILKLPFLIFDLFVAFTLSKIVKPSQQRLAISFWLFNPVNLYAIYALGQFDIIPSFFTALAWFLWEKKLIVRSAFCLGLAISFKAYAIFLLPFFLLYKEKFRLKAYHFLISLGFYSITILPFLSSEYFKENFLFSGLSKRILEEQFSIGVINISIFPVLYLFLIFLALIRRSSPLSVFILSALLLIFASTKFHPQWIIWVTPFLTLLFVRNQINFLLFSLFSSIYFIIFAFFGDKYLTFSLLSPISSMFQEIPPITQIIGEKSQLFLNIFRAGFSIICIAIIFHALRRTK